MVSPRSRRCPNHVTIVIKRPLVESSCEERNYRQLDQVQHPSYSQVRSGAPRMFAEETGKSKLFQKRWSFLKTGDQEILSFLVVMFHTETKDCRVCPEVGDTPSHFLREHVWNGVSQIWTSWHLYIQFWIILPRCNKAK